MKEFLIALLGGRGDLDAWLECNNEQECRDVIIPIVQQRDELLLALKDARAIFELAYDCAEKKFNDECMMHIGIGGARADKAIAKCEA